MTLRSKAAAIALSMSGATIAVASPDLDAGPVITKAIDGFVRPAYAEFHDAASALEAAMAGLCSSPSETALESARTAFGVAVEAWSVAETIRFGPATEQNRLERILFWPDRKGTGLKQVQAALAAKDPTAADPSQLAGKSVAMQGLGALEFVLFGAGAETLSGKSERYRCDYGAAIASNLDAIAGELEIAWSAPDGFAALWIAPAADNPLYRDDSEALGELVDVFIDSLELVRDVRLDGFFGAKPDKDKPKQALFWRSGNTVRSLAANIAGMKSLFEASGLGDAVSPNMRWLADAILFEFGEAAEAASSAEGSVADILADPVRRDELESLSVVVSSLSELFSLQLSGTFALTSGFSSLDGD